MTLISKAKEKKQEEIDRRMGKTPTGTTAVPTNTNGNGRFGWMKRSKIEWSIALALFGAILFFWKLYAPGLQLAKIGGWSWDHWVSLGVFFGILFTIVALNAQTLGKATKILNWLLVGALLMIFIGFPAWFGFIGWVNTPSSSHISSHSGISSHDNSGTLKVPAGGNARINSQPGHNVIFTGDGFTTHCVYRDGRPEGIVGSTTNPCGDGPMLEVYVHNETEKEIIVSYARVKK
ncbi:MAG: hypothetical protein NTU85_02165 [Candidatus Kaiserbacteria bacterium]|nr:hypothetical protein [Candidatus Kaiserbacteria bacterium]